MSMLRSLRIRLGAVDAGSLFALDDGRCYFRFDDDYAIQGASRPILSQLYSAASEERTRAQLLDPTLAANRGDGRGGLPPFFQNLLPEGQLRKHLVQRAGLAPDDEFGLLAYCGKDLPGDVSAVAEELDERGLGRLLGQGHDSYEMSSGQLPVPGGESLSGVQPKLALVRQAGGRYVMRSRDRAGAHFIAKLPATDYPNMPQVEFASLTLAAAAGVDTCKFELEPLSAIAEHLPFGLRNDASRFLLVHRFDRDAPTPTTRLHMEDFAQVTGTAPGAKYVGTYAAIGVVLAERSARGVEDVFELLRRIKVNELLGNFDAHLKNFSLLYRKPQEAVLSPAYDIVAYAAYVGGDGHALAFVPGQKGKQLLTPAILRRLANIWNIPEPKLQAVLVETVERAMTQWPALIGQLPFTDDQRAKLLKHIDGNASVQAWRRRAARKEARRGEQG
ncbi:type II toxin-antitoxin system HipA family toxin [Herbaspirillum sp. LeCh32-8]|uniref:type II toxin-antitoxin system HipA family toxin n=1 Tax=Herbaspirillum sp. LeCh32-8 TaxID=2821356 RepID=UPI001AE387C9|nr:type II toxin-antitoxin system HipA family toxin [Herbaspirillum sp. LeCh32-8]MBP0599470.1 type II toxin-antitoxin system HipA family toxin [Herbaspirillum sp. LeCh32-8]